MIILRSNIKVCLKRYVYYVLNIGEFWQLPNNHFKGQGCPKCKKEKLSQQHLSNKNKILNTFKKVHGDKYDYSKVEYNGLHTKVCIICPIHGEFWQEPNSHIHGCGCPKCAGKNKTTKEFIEKSNIIHNNKYDYSKVEYITAKEKVCIVCPIHGEFWQSPYKHSNGQGCPYCNESHLEREVRIFLENKKINFVEQKRFDWLGLQSLDFYLPDYNIAIECQGIQHFRIVDFSSKTEKNILEKNFKKIKENDLKKYKLCKNNNIKIIYYTNLNYKKFLTENLISKLDDLYEYINKTKLFI